MTVALETGRGPHLSANLSLEAARELADEVLFPSANEIDAMPVLPRARLDLLAARGWYGLSAPSSGLQLQDAWPILEAFAGGCLTTTFVWTQHLGTAPACAFGSEHLRPWVQPLASGERRSTVAYAGVLPDPPLRAERHGADWLLNGFAPWVSGWGLADVIHVSARTPDDDVVWLLVDTSSEGLHATPRRLLAVNASATVELRFANVRVNAARETSRFPWAEWPGRDAMGLRTNGSLALGVAARCLQLTGPSALDEQLQSCRLALDSGTAETMPAARARAAAFAVQAASALLAHDGSRSIVVGHHAQRLFREAGVLLVFASRPSIKRELATQLSTTRPPEPRVR
jgi:alkylation response protein AidB-like acyl-CoA dehydrogenase